MVQSSSRLLVGILFIFLFSLLNVLIIHKRICSLFFSLGNTIDASSYVVQATASQDDDDNKLLIQAKGLNEDNTIESEIEVEAHDNEKLMSDVIHWNSTDHITPPTIYLCTGSGQNGYTEAKKIFTSAFPEYSVVELPSMNIGNRKFQLPPQFFSPNYTNSYDLLLDTFDFAYCNVQIFSWLSRYYNGHYIFFSGESQKSHPVNHLLGNRKHFHSFGPLLNPTSGDMVLTYMQYVWFDKFKDYLPPDVLLDARKRPRGNAKTFMIYANSNCVPFREEAVARLSQLGVVHCDGKCTAKRVVGTAINRTNIISTRGTHKIGITNWWQNVDVYRDYKFCFAMEHETEHATYITEKILMAFSAGCIPIYYGPKLIFDIFNEKAFVFYNISDPEPALQRIKELNENQELYNATLNLPIAANGESTIEKYFSFNDTIGNGHLKREIRKRIGLTDKNFVP